LWPETTLPTGMDYALRWPETLALSTTALLPLIIRGRGLGEKLTTVCDNAMGKVTTIPETLVTDDLEGCVTAQDVVTQDVKATATRYAAATNTTRKSSTASHTAVPSLTPTTVKSPGGRIRPTLPLVLPPLATFLHSRALNNTH
jgi:hypothetical protein